MSKLIELKGVSKFYDGEQVLHHIDLYIRDKEFITLLGPSGCGKTTTLRLIGGFEMPDEGEIFLRALRSQACPPTNALSTQCFKNMRFSPISMCMTILPLR